MAFEAKILADSMHPNGVSRLTTFQVTFPRCILAEFNTHRMISRNAASSRAIPVARLIKQVESDPFIPEFRANQKGMVAETDLSEVERELAERVWRNALNEAVMRASELASYGVHKQYVNRLLEPFAWVTVICTATEWANFFALRCAEDAEPSFQRIARMMLELYRTNEPKQLGYWASHLPMIDQGEDLRGFNKWMVSAGRCARVSYLTHEGKRDPKADEDLANRLIESGHWSPFEHQAKPGGGILGNDSNLKGWIQHRKVYDNENITKLPEVI